MSVAGESLGLEAAARGLPLDPANPAKPPLGRVLPGVEVTEKLRAARKPGGAAAALTDR